MEDEMFLEIRQDKGVEEPCLFPKEEWDSLTRFTMNSIRLLWLGSLPKALQLTVLPHFLMSFYLEK